jgi:hypothetical protein
MVPQGMESRMLSDIQGDVKETALNKGIMHPGIHSPIISLWYQHTAENHKNNTLSTSQKPFLFQALKAYQCNLYKTTWHIVLFLFLFQRWKTLWHRGGKLYSSHMFTREVWFTHTCSYTQHLWHCPAQMVSIALVL